MNESDALRAEFLETLFQKTSSGGAWSEKGKDTFETAVGNLRIQVERGPIGERVAYSVWIWGPDGLIDNIYDDDLKSAVPKLPNFEDFGQVIRSMFEGAKGKIVLNRMKNALDILKSASAHPPE